MSTHRTLNELEQALCDRLNRLADEAMDTGRKADAERLYLELLHFLRLLVDSTHPQIVQVQKKIDLLTDVPPTPALISLE